MAHPIHEANENSPYGNLTKDDFYKKHQILHQEKFILNQQNLKIFTQSWQPNDLTRKINGFVGMIHGYTSESSWLFELNAVGIAKEGFFVCALDLQGHGFSEGTPDHVTDIQPLLEDCKQFFESARSEYRDVPCFLYGESLGGALAILVCLEQKDAWKGLILSGPMCEISSKFKPIWPLEKLLPPITYIAPMWRISILSSVLNRAIKLSWKIKVIKKSPNRRTNGKPTTATSLELLKVCEQIKKKCNELDVPMLILHGGEDAICDPKGSKLLYESAASKDKTLKIFESMWHQLIGEPNESVQVVFDFMMTWIVARSN